MRSSAKPSSISIASDLLIMLLLLISTIFSEAQLTPNFYANTCPQALSTIRTAVRAAVNSERRMAASLIRLHFHDCFVQGCDASVLLVDAPGIISEQKALQNKNSLRGYEVIDGAKSAVETVCPGVVSCADILAVAARDSSEYANGPTWTVKLGRRDSTAANKDLAEANLPFTIDDLNALIPKFARQGFSPKEMVALSGSHTIGQARCVAFRTRIYNETDIDASFASTRKRNCPPSTPAGDSNLAPLDPVTPNSFDNNYFRNLMQKKGLLHSDQVLFNGSSTDDFVASYSKDQAAFFSDFAAAMVKMADIDPITGSSGEIRKICSAKN